MCYTRRWSHPPTLDCGRLPESSGWPPSRFPNNWALLADWFDRQPAATGQRGGASIQRGKNAAVRTRQSQQVGLRDLAVAAQQGPGRHGIAQRQIVEPEIVSLLRRGSL